MKLGDSEREMLDGKCGRLVQGAMDHLVKLGEAYGATDMVDIEFASVYTTVDIWGGASADVFLTLDAFQEAVDLGIRVKVPTIAGIGSVDVNKCEFLKIPSGIAENFRKQCDLEKRMGIIFLPTCTPYLVTTTNRFPLGTHMVSIESSAIPYYNSVLGARCNRDGMAAFFSALTGKYPRFGYHLSQNRKATYIIDVQSSLSSYLDYGLLGLHIGEIVGPNVPIIFGIEKPTVYEMIHFSSGVSSGGPVALFHVDGVTPEAIRLEETINLRGLKKRVIVRRNDLDNIAKKYLGNVGEKVDFVVLGCPYYSIYELKLLAEMMTGRQTCVPTWVHTDPMTKSLAQSMGYIDIIEETGAHVISGTCPILSAGCPGPVYTMAHPEYSAGVIATDSIKQAHYSGLLLRSRKTILGSMEQCVEAGCMGVWN